MGHFLHYLGSLQWFNPSISCNKNNPIYFLLRLKGTLEEFYLFFFLQIIENNIESYWL